MKLLLRHLVAQGAGSWDESVPLVLPPQRWPCSGHPDSMVGRWLPRSGSPALRELSVAAMARLLMYNVVYEADQYLSG